VLPQVPGFSMSPRALLHSLYRIAVDAAHPRTCLVPHLPAPPGGRLIVLAAGKAGGAMAEVAEAHYLDTVRMDPARLLGLAVARHGYGRPLRHLPMVEAGHPVPDAAGLKAAVDMLDLARSATVDDLVLVLLSGGASANLVAPAPGLTIADKQALTKQLLRSGAHIGEMNTVRKHLSAIKGGRLAAAAHPARVVTLAISDVPGDDPAVIGSGPTVPDPTTLADARAVIAKFSLTPPAAILSALDNPANESPKPDHPAFAGNVVAVISTPQAAFAAAEEAVRAAGYEPVMLGDRVEGEAREVARAHAQLAREFQAQGRKAAILSGGELTVTLTGNGRGGPNQEYMLAMVAALDGTQGIAALAGDTDGTDGGGGSASDPAGALADGASAAKARKLGLDPARFLADNDSTTFFERMDDLLSPGPTFTNVNDFRCVLVDRI
jgi:hydroxypyruvate reductase